MINLQPINNSSNGAAMPLVMGMNANGGAGFSVTCLGKLPAVRFAPASPRLSKTDAWRQRSEQRRFTVEQFCAELNRKIDLKIKIVSDKRGIFAGNRVVVCAGGVEMTLSCLPVEREAEGTAAGSIVDYFVWEISLDGGSVLRPRAGKGRLDLDRCCRTLRCEIVGY